MGRVPVTRRVDHNVIATRKPLDVLYETVQCMHCGRVPIGRDWQIFTDHEGDMVVSKECFEELTAEEEC